MVDNLCFRCEYLQSEFRRKPYLIGTLPSNRITTKKKSINKYNNKHRSIGFNYDLLTQDLKVDIILYRKRQTEQTKRIESHRFVSTTQTADLGFQLAVEQINDN